MKNKRIGLPVRLAGLIHNIGDFEMSIRKILFLAVAGLMISPALMAADIDGPSDERIFSDEFLSTVGTGTIAGGVLAVTLGAEYTASDILILDFSGSALIGLSMPTVVNSPAGAINGVTLVILGADTDSAVYRVTDVVAGAANTTVGVVVQFGFADTIKFNALAVQAAAGVTVSYSAETNSKIPLDTGGGDLREVEYIQVEDEYDLEVTLKFDAIIEVEGDTTFTSTDQFDIATLDVIIEPTIGAGFGTTLDDIDIVYSGNFGWIIDEDLTMDDVQPITGVVTVTGTGCGSVVVTAVTIAATCDGTGAIDLKLDPSKNLDAAGDLAILPGTSFSVAVTVNYTGVSAGTRVFTESAGTWLVGAISVTIDIKPGKFRDRPNRLNPNRKSIKVAILGTMDFDALQVDQTTIRFGPDEAPLDPAQCKVKDFNEDGLPDLSCKFKISETGIACGDTEATLIGETFGGESISGTDSIETVGCT